MLRERLGRVRLPRDLASVTAISDAEGRPADVGMTEAGREEIWAAVEKLYRTGTQPAIALCLRRQGQVIIDRAIGHARGNSPGGPPDEPQIRVTPTTPICLFSASKGHTAMLMHLLQQHGALKLTDRAADYLPELGRHGKERITLYHLLTHRAGIPSVPGSEADKDILLEPERALLALYDARPIGEPGETLAYHALSAGFVLGEVARRATGKDLRQLLRELILEPLGFQLSSYGIAAERRDEVAVNAVTGVPLPSPLARLATRALGVTWDEATGLSNDPRFFANILPSANIVTTANEASRFYQLLLDGGQLDSVRIFEPETIRDALIETAYLTFDRRLLVPVRYSVGLMLGAKRLSLYGPATSQAYGHLGFMGVLCWADPQRRVAAALLTTGKLLADVHWWPFWQVLSAISRHCPVLLL